MVDYPDYIDPGSTKFYVIGAVLKMQKMQKNIYNA
jgi:hypothetical protein